jgi:hypothetical protein
MLTYLDHIQVSALPPHEGHDVDCHYTAHMAHTAHCGEYHPETLFHSATLASLCKVCWAVQACAGQCKLERAMAQCKLERAGVVRAGVGRGSASSGQC